MADNPSGADMFLEMTLTKGAQRHEGQSCCEAIATQRLVMSAGYVGRSCRLAISTGHVDNA
jgi:hypothetical protein